MEEKKIYPAIVATMKDIGAIGKKDKNDYDKYMFRGIDAVYNALQPAMVKNGIFVAPRLMSIEQNDRTSQKGGTMIHTKVEVLYTFYAEDGSFVEVLVPGEAMDRSDKSSNKAMSAAFKYACFQTFCIPTEEMKDADQESPEAGTKVQKDLLPHGEGMTEERLERIMGEITRTGTDMKKILAAYKVKDIRDLTEAQYISCMNRFEKTPDKA